MAAASSPKVPLPADVERLHGLGVSRNGIARELKVSTRQVDKVARKLGLSFSAASVEDALKARAYRADNQRLEIAENLREVALRESRKAKGSNDALETSRHVKAAVDAVQAEQVLEETTSATTRARKNDQYPTVDDPLLLHTRLFTPVSGYGISAGYVNAHGGEGVT